MIGAHSILRVTGQMWKFWILPVGSLATATIILGAFILLPTPRNGWYLATIVLGLIVGMISFVFPTVFIRCPVCGTRWLWLAVSKKHDTGWFDWLVTQTRCAVCGYGAKSQGLQGH